MAEALKRLLREKAMALLREVGNEQAVSFSYACDATSFLCSAIATSAVQGSRLTRKAAYWRSS